MQAEQIQGECVLEVSDSTNQNTLVKDKFILEVQRKIFIKKKKKHIGQFQHVTKFYAMESDSTKLKK